MHLVWLSRIWKSIENHNRCNENEIGKLKDLLYRKKIRDNFLRRNQTDIRLRSYTYFVAPVDVFYAFVTVPLVLLFLLL